jgi:hypothetical protein
MKNTGHSANPEEHRAKQIVATVRNRLIITHISISLGIGSIATMTLLNHWVWRKCAAVFPLILT